MDGSPKVYGPYWHEKRQRHYICWKVDGKESRRYRKSEEEAAALKAEIENPAAAPQPAPQALDIPDGFELSAAGSKAYLEHIVNRSAEVAESGTPAELGKLRKLIAIVRDAMAAFQPYDDHDKTQAALRRAIAYIEDIRAGRADLDDAEKQAVFSSLTDTLRRTPGSVQGYH